MVPVEPPSEPVPVALAVELSCTGPTPEMALLEVTVDPATEAVPVVPAIAELAAELPPPVTLLACGIAAQLECRPEFQHSSAVSRPFLDMVWHVTSQSDR